MRENSKSRKAAMVYAGRVAVLLGLFLLVFGQRVFADSYRVQIPIDTTSTYFWQEDGTVELSWSEGAPKDSKLHLFALNKQDEDDETDDRYEIVKSIALREGANAYTYHSPNGKTDAETKLLAVVTDLDAVDMGDFLETKPPFATLPERSDVVLKRFICTHIFNETCDRTAGERCSHDRYNCTTNRVEAQKCNHKCGETCTKTDGSLCAHVDCSPDCKAKLPPPPCTHRCVIKCDRTDGLPCDHENCPKTCVGGSAPAGGCTHACDEACNLDDCPHKGCGDDCSVQTAPKACTHACGEKCDRTDCIHKGCGRIENVGTRLNPCTHKENVTCERKEKGDGMSCTFRDYEHLCKIDKPENFKTELYLQQITIMPEEPLAVSHLESIAFAKTKDALSGNDFPSELHAKAQDTIEIKLTFSKNSVRFIDNTSEIPAGTIEKWTEEAKKPGPGTSFVFTIKLDKLSLGEDVADELEYRLDFKDKNGNLFSLSPDDISDLEQVKKLTCLGSFTHSILSAPETPLDAPHERMALEGDGVQFTISAPSRPLAITAYQVAGAAKQTFTPPYDFQEELGIHYQANPADGLLDNSPIPLNALRLMDLAGNSASGSLTDSASCVTYYATSATPVEDTLSMTAPSYEEKMYFAKKDDQVIVTWETQSRLYRGPMDLTIGENHSEGIPTRERDHSRNLWVFTFTVNLAKTESFTDEMPLCPIIYYEDVPYTFPAATPVPNQVIFLHPLRITSIQMNSIDTDKVETPDNDYAINGSLLEATIRLNHKHYLNETITIAGLPAEEMKPSTRPQSGKPFYFYDAEILQYTVRLLLPSYKSDPVFESIRLTEDSPVELTISARDYANNNEAVAGIDEALERGIAKPVTYFAPLELHNVQVTATEMRQDKDGYLALKGGEEIGIEFATSHPVLPQQMELTLGRHTAQPVFSRSTENGLYLYTARYTAGEVPLLELADMEKLAPKFTVNDQMNQNTRYPADYKGENQKWTPRYYAPIEITDVTIETSNKKDETRFAKDEDRVSVAFRSNHFLEFEGNIAGRDFAVSQKRVESGSEVSEWTLTYTLANKDLQDLDIVPFAFTARDIAENEPVNYTNHDPSVTGKIIYYAPIEATASIASNNKRSEYAKNGDTITISLEAQHETAPTEAQLGTRDVSGNLDYKEKPQVAVLIPGGESQLSEGELFFSVMLEDPAGNTLSVSETKDESKVTYDRTSPEVTILPGFNGVTNKDVNLSFLYSDMYLDRETLSCVVNESERVPDGEKTNSAEPSVTYTQPLSISKEGEYQIEGTVGDMAGNEAEFTAACGFIIDKTGPVLNFTLDPKTYAAGFSLNRLLSIEEEMMKQLACTLTDLQGVQDWTLESPIETEGKKTVTLVAEDLAGNVSVPLTCDFYIDASAPLPTVRENQRGKALTQNIENVITDAGTTLQVSLARLHVGDEEPDRFTQLQLLDENGQLAVDLLAGTASPDGIYYLNLPELGQYTLVAQAEDDVKHNTGELRYPIIYREMYWLELALQDTPLGGFGWVQNITNLQMGLAIGGFVLLPCGGIGLLAVRRHRRKMGAKK